MPKPFHWSLKKVSSDSVRILNSIWSYLPPGKTRDDFAGAINNILDKHIGMKGEIELESAESVDFGAWAKRLPLNCVVAVLGLSPAKGKAFLHIDPKLADLFIGRLLGGEAVTTGLHPITEAEQGVLQYLLMQVLSGFHTVCGKSQRAQFRFERFAVSPSAVGQLGNPGDVCGALTWSLCVGETSGYVQALFPRSFVDSAMTEPQGKEGHQLARLRSFSWISSTMWIEGGMCELTPDDMNGLEAGDVVLFDQSGLSMRGRRIGGEVILRVGSDREKGIRAKIVNAKDGGVKLVQFE